ncbi:MAG: hypothetical protein IKK62_03850 [Bacteroidaceae bacterium]|nr:hypothetical protein [Bacteroidaceae bacterium]
MKKDYSIAGHRIRIEGCEEWIKAVATLDGFKPFEVDAEGEALAVFTLTDELAPEMTEVQYESEVDGIVDRFGRYEGGYLFVMTPPDSASLSLWKEEGSNVVKFNGQLMPRLVRFALWIAYGLVTMAHRTVAVHTSVIQYKGRTVLFLGESGTGKSTHTRLWRENIEGAVLLNDDSPILRIIDGKPWMYGSPWSGKTPCYKQESYPLAACVRLSQAPYNKIQRLSIPQAYAALHPSCPPDFAYDDTLYDCISETIGEVLAQIPLYHLACLPNAEAARLSCKTVFGE